MSPTVPAQPPRFLLTPKQPHSHYPFPLPPPLPRTTSYASLSRRRDRSRPIASRHVYGRDEGYGEVEEDGDEEEEEDDRSLDLLVKFVENVFNKVSRRARKSVRSVLPSSLSTNLVGFAVNGVLVLAFLWVLRAFLEKLRSWQDVSLIDQWYEGCLCQTCDLYPWKCGVCKHFTHSRGLVCGNLFARQ